MDLQIHWSSDPSIYRSTDPLIYRFNALATYHIFTDPSIFRFSDLLIYRSIDLAIYHRSTDLPQIHQSSDPSIYSSTDPLNLQIHQCSDRSTVLPIYWSLDPPIYRIIRDLKIPRYRCTGTGSVPLHVKCSSAWLFRLRYPKNKHAKLTLYMHVA